MDRVMSTPKSGFQTIKPVRAYEQIVSQIEAALASGSLKPGEHLPSERELMQHFGVSRPTVREALRVLESNGLVRSSRGNPQGPEVLDPSPDLLYRPIAQLVRTKHLSLGEFVPVRLALESLACSTAAIMRTDEQLSELTTAVDQMRSVSDGNGDSHLFGEADLAFHSKVWEATNNLLIAFIGNATRELTSELIEEKIEHSSNAREVMRLWVQYDSDILGAIRAGDPMLASYLVRRYIYEHYNEYLTALEREALRALVGPDPRDPAAG